MTDQEPYSCMFQYCKEVPCAHSTFSTDPDNRDDFLDHLVDPNKHEEVWRLYHSRYGIPAEKAEEYASQLARCKRIIENWDKIRDEERFNKGKYLDENWGYKGRNLTFTPEEEKEIRELVKKRAQELMEGKDDPAGDVNI